MLQGTPDVAAAQEAAAAFGLLLQVDAPPAPELWAELVPAVRIFDAMRTQWRTGVNGATGMDYLALPIVEQRLRISPRQSRAAWPHLQMMEAEALRWFDSQRGK